MIRVDSKALHQIVKAVMPVVKRKNHLPILGQIAVQGNGKLQVSATNLEIGVRTWLDIPSDVDFDVCVPAHTFKDIVQNSSGEVEISVNGKCKVASASGSREIHFMDVADFPAVDRGTLESGKGRGIAYIQGIKTQNFVDDLKKAMSATSATEQRFNLNCIYLDGANGCVVATDGHRLQKIQTKWLPRKAKALLHYSAVKACLSILSKFKKVHKLDLNFYEKRMWITSEVFEISIWLGDGDYPQYENVIPKEKPETVATVNRDEFLKALKLVRIMSSERNRAVTFEFDWLSDALTLSCVHPDLGSALTSMDTDVRVPWTDPVMFNVDYVIAAVKQQDVDQIPLCLTVDGPSYFGDELVMPMRK